MIAYNRIGSLILTNILCLILQAFSLAFGVSLCLLHAIVLSNHVEDLY